MEIEWNETEQLRVEVVQHMIENIIYSFLLDLPRDTVSLDEIRHISYKSADIILLLLQKLGS